MGGDGGSISKRSDVVVKKQLPSKPGKDTIALNKWTVCAVSQAPLKPPIVACELGNLYNKDGLITNHLLSPHKLNQFKHIRSLKDTIPCSISFPNPAGSAKELLDSPDPGSSEHKNFVCPITGVPGNGKYHFLLMRNCGCVLSERAVKEVPSNSCLVCHKPFAEDDLKHDEQFIVIYPSSHEESERQREKMNARRSRLKDLKGKKSMKGDTPVTDLAGDSKVDDEASGSKRKLAEDHEDGATKAPKQSVHTDAASTARDKQTSKAPSSSTPATTATSSSRSSNINYVPFRDPRSLAKLVEDKVESQKKKSAIFDRLFLTKDDLKSWKPSQISTKPESCNARL
jgi:hypothetical protein